MGKFAALLVLVLIVLVLFTYPKGDGSSLGARTVAAIRATVKQ